MADMLANMRFPMGLTEYNGQPIDFSNNGANLNGLNYEGKEYNLEDTPPNGPPVHRTYIYKRVRLVRNWSGGGLSNNAPPAGAINLLPGKLVQYAAGYHGRRVDSYSYLSAQPAYAVDEYLPAAGVPYGDLFYIVTEGPAKCIYDPAGTTAISEGDAVMALTAASSQAAAAGCVAECNFAATTTTGGNPPTMLGWAMSSVTSGNSGQGILVDIRRH